MKLIRHEARAASLRQQSYLFLAVCPTCHTVWCLPDRSPVGRSPVPGWPDWPAGQIDRIHQPRCLAFLKNLTISMYMPPPLKLVVKQDTTRRDVRIARHSFLFIMLSIQPQLSHRPILLKRRLLNQIFVEDYRIDKITIAGNMLEFLILADSLLASPNHVFLFCS